MLLACRAGPQRVRATVSRLALSALLAVPIAAVGAPAGGAAAAPGPSGAAPIAVVPGAVQMVVRSGHQREQTVTVTNRGTTEVPWLVADGTGRAVRPPTAGNVLENWLPGVTIAWGVGVEGDNIWISDADLLRNDSFTRKGSPRGEGWPTPWASDMPGPADMAYVPDRGLMCQVKVGTDNGVYCWNPRTGAIVTTITGDFPWTAAPQRGLAYRPDDDTFYIGGWDQGVIYHITGLGHAKPGQVISQCAPPDPAISGLGWSTDFGLLWAVTQSNDSRIYALNAETCTPLRTITPPEPAQFKGGGLDVDAGNLWVVSAGSVGQPGPSGRAFLVTSGLPNIRDAAWLSTTPRTGTLAGGHAQRLTVRVDARGLAPGRYRATLYLVTGDARRPLTTVPVRVLVTPDRNN